MKQSAKYATKKQRVEIFWKSLLPSERIGKVQALGIINVYSLPMNEIKEKVYDAEPLHQQSE